MQWFHDMPFGAIPVEGGVRFRLWAPAQLQVRLVLGAESGAPEFPMARTHDGWFELTSAEACAGSRYCFRLGGGEYVPDPATRFQPDDVHRPSEVIDPRAFRWHDDGWRGRPWKEAVIYELHVGTFTPAGTFQAAIDRLDHLKSLGVSAVELMPVADFPGARNWGYDGVLPFAPDARYGRPEDLKALVEAAHVRGLMVFLDVVYNHFGPEGNYLHLYAPQFFTARHHTPWGAAVNFDDAGSRTVRDFFIHNALYWLSEYRFDGLRLDAVHAIVDDSTPDILRELAQTVAAGPGSERHVHLVLENDRNEARYLDRDAAGHVRSFAAQWNDDIHHAFHVLATGETEGYYEDYAEGPLRHLGRALTEGFCYQGEPSRHRGGAPRGEPSAHLPPTAFVSFLQTHDQVGNRAFGERLTQLASPEALRAVTAILLLAPPPPLLFMGQEWGSSAPFPFFCDFGPDLAAAVTDGRRREFARFPAFRDPVTRARIPDPNDPATFASAVLDWGEPARTGHREWLLLHRELLALRAAEISPRLDATARADGFHSFGDRAMAVRWGLAGGSRLTLICNLGDTPTPAAREPAGKLLFGTAPTKGDTLPPWSAYWFLENAP